MYGKRRETILTNESGPEAGVDGVVEDVKGRAKEAAGAVSGNESLKQEGQAQQDKAAAQRDVAAKEAEAERARVQASAAEAEQRAPQQTPAPALTTSHSDTAQQTRKRGGANSRRRTQAFLVSGGGVP